MQPVDLSWPPRRSFMIADLLLDHQLGAAGPLPAAGARLEASPPPQQPQAPRQPQAPQAPQEPKEPLAPLDLRLAPAGSGPQAAERRRVRTMFTECQLASLEWRFGRNKYLTTADRVRLAKALALSQLQVKTWFQNRRMKWKREILATGAAKSPTKPKGRPRRDSIPPIDD